MVGTTSGRAKALVASDGHTKIKEAGTSMSIGIFGFDRLPTVGDTPVICDNDPTARTLAESRAKIARKRNAAAYQADLMESVATTFAADGKFKERKEIYVVVKVDVQGSADALTRALQTLKMDDDEAFAAIKVLVSKSGEVTKSDVTITSVTPNTTILAYKCSANYTAAKEIRQLGILIEYDSIIYDAIELVESRMQEVLSLTPRIIYWKGCYARCFQYWWNGEYCW